MDWLGIVSSIGSVGAIAAAIAAWRYARETRKTYHAQIVLALTESYSSPKMHDAMKNLRWYKENTPDFMERFARKDLNESAMSSIDSNRRLYAHYFHRLRILLTTSTIDETFLKRIVSPDQVDFLFEIIEPLDKAANPDYDTSTYEIFRKLYNRNKK
jgi:hypothetical protein